MVVVADAMWWYALRGREWDGQEEILLANVRASSGSTGWADGRHGERRKSGTTVGPPSPGGTPSGATNSDHVAGGSGESAVTLTAASDSGRTGDTSGSAVPLDEAMSSSGSGQLQSADGGSAPAAPIHNEEQHQQPLQQALQPEHSPRPPLRVRRRVSKLTGKNRSQASPS